jgi:hypothetical protein
VVTLRHGGMGFGLDCWCGGSAPRTRNRAHKHFQLDPDKISRAQRVLRAQTETEAIERALDLVISEHKSNRLGAEANDRFVKSGIEIKDVYGKLEP